MSETLTYKRKFLIFKPVFTYSKPEKKVRLFRITFARQKKQFTCGLQPKLWKFEKSCYRLKVWLFGVVLKCDYGGWGGIYPN